jgi:predicted P-loop ATPase/GTPase
MSRKILVVGFQTYEAGKTTLCRALIHGFKKAGVTLVPFKPHSGISYWNQFNTFQQSLAKSTLLSSDIIELERAAESQIPLEVLNPVNRLSGPVLDRGIPEEKLVFQEFMAERFTYHDGLAHKNIYYFNGTLNLSRLRDMETFYLRIKKNAQKTYFVRNFEELAEAYSENFEKATTTCYKRIQDRGLVVESFNDAAYPFNNAEDCDTVLCVSSNTVLQFQDRKYFEAIELHGKEKPKLQLTVPEAYTPRLIKEKFVVQPLSNEERNDHVKLAQNYSIIIKELLRNT